MSTKPVLVPRPVRTPAEPAETFTLLERAALHRGDPRSMVFSTIGAIWAFYFLWMHDSLFALTSVVVSAALGRLASINLDEAVFARTILGKIMLLHLHPINIAIQTFGGIYLIYAVWIHSVLAILAATSVVFAGHLWGWDKVHDAF